MSDNTFVLLSIALFALTWGEPDIIDALNKLAEAALVAATCK